MNTLNTFKIGIHAENIQSKDPSEDLSSLNHSRDVGFVIKD